MTTVSSTNLISSEVYVISKSSSGWVVEDKRALVLDVLSSAKENCRMVMIKKDNKVDIVKDDLVYTKKEAALKEVKFLNQDNFDAIVEYAKDFDWKFKKSAYNKFDSICKKINDVDIAIKRSGTIEMNGNTFKSRASSDYIKSFIEFIK